MTGVREMVLLTLGWEHLPKSVSVADAPPEERAVEQIRRLKSIAAEKGYPLVPGHDAVVWPALTRELAGRYSARPVTA